MTWRTSGEVCSFISNAMCIRIYMDGAEIEGYELNTYPGMYEQTLSK